jgi:hypothetical protein
MIPVIDFTDYKSADWDLVTGADWHGYDSPLHFDMNSEDAMVMLARSFTAMGMEWTRAMRCAVEEVIA